MFCYSDWTRLLRQREKGVTVRSRGHFRLPECESLPRMAASNNNATCTKSGITDMRYDLATSKMIVKGCSQMELDALYYLHISVKVISEQPQQQICCL